jgi:hypothetical protein
MFLKVFLTVRDIFNSIHFSPENPYLAIQPPDIEQVSGIANLQKHFFLCHEPFVFELPYVEILSF